jgi:probable inactive protein kinase-like protein SgK071
MENYDVIEKLGKGAQGAVYLVKDKRNNDEECVLKKVECCDEAEADKAFREVQDLPTVSYSDANSRVCNAQALALETLKHKYVCGYRELFVNWDRDVRGRATDGRKANHGLYRHRLCMFAL